MPKSLMVVFSNPTSPEQEEAYNNWYTNKHLKDVVGVPGIVGATRYKLEKSVGLEGISTNACQYLALYELEADTPGEMEAIIQAMGAAIEAGDVDVDISIDGTTIETSFAKAICDRVS